MVHWVAITCLMVGAITVNKPVVELKTGGEMPPVFLLFIFLDVGQRI